MKHLLKTIKAQTSPHKQLENNSYYKLRSIDAAPATFYGLPKGHKMDISLRPITSSFGYPTCQIFKHLSNLLSLLQSNIHGVKNSQEFADKVVTYTIGNDEYLVSFDVVSLCTSIPVHLALEMSKERLRSDQTLHERTNLLINNIMKFLEFVLDSNYFILQGIYYK